MLESSRTNLGFTHFKNFPDLDTISPDPPRLVENHGRFSKFPVLLVASNCCNFFIRHPLRLSSIALERTASETFENEVSRCLTPPELGDRGS